MTDKLSDEEYEKKLLKKETHVSRVRLRNRTSEEIHRDINRQKKMCTYIKCSRKGQLIDFKDYYKNKAMADGHSVWCKECSKHFKYKTKNGYSTVRKHRKKGSNKETANRYYQKNKEVINSNSKKNKHKRKLRKAIRDAIYTCENIIEMSKIKIDNSDQIENYYANNRINGFVQACWAATSITRKLERIPELKARKHK